MEVFVVRQAIFDRSRGVYGYKLLFGSSGHAELPATESSATQLLADSLLSVGLERLVGNMRAFVNLGREALLAGWYGALPQQSSVIELSKDLDSDTELLELCRKLRTEGYTFALDDFVPRAAPQPLLEWASLVTVEVQSLPWSQQAEIVGSMHRERREVVAKKVETYEEFERAREAGYDYFQGFFFAKPLVLRTRQIPASITHCLGLLRESQQVDLDLQRLETIISRDLSLSFKLLRHVNSSLLSHRREIRSLRHALTFLGEYDLRKWIALAALPALAQDKPPELVFQSVVRGAFCQSVARLATAPEEQQAFLMGLFSLLAAVMDRPLETTLAEINLAPEITAVLLGSAPHNHRLSSIYDLLIAYETADWSAVDAMCAKLFIAPHGVAHAYVEAVRWAGESLPSPSPGPQPPEGVLPYPRAPEHRSAR